MDKAIKSIENWGHETLLKNPPAIEGDEKTSCFLLGSKYDCGFKGLQDSSQLKLSPRVVVGWSLEHFEGEL